MPELAVLRGNIIIQMFVFDDNNHKVPRLRVVYSEYEAVYNLKGRCVEGELPSKMAKRVRAWILLRENALALAWSHLVNGESYEKIAP